MCSASLGRSVDWDDESYWGDFSTTEDATAGWNTRKPQSTDTARLDKLGAYLSDANNYLCGPFLSDPGWQFGHPAEDSYCSDACGKTLREAIDNLPD